MREVELHPKAAEEARRAFDRYEIEVDGLGAAFIEELDHAFLAIREAPATWPQYLFGTRRLLLRRFPFSVVYRINSERIQVVAIAHQRRRPAYWRTRGD